MSIHKELLCFYSPYYSAALNGKFLEAQKDLFEVDLSDKDLHRFATWIYTGERPSPMVNCDVMLYIFADQVDILALRRTIIGGFMNTIPRYSLAKIILKDLPQNSPLQKFLLDTYVAHWQPKHDQKDPCLLDSNADPNHLLAAFTYRVMEGLALRKMRNPPGCPCCNIACSYHEHSSKEEWKASMLIQSVRLRLLILTNVCLACGQKEGSRMPISLR